MRLFEKSQITIVRNNDGKAFRKILKLDKRPLHILCGKSELRKYSRVYTQFVTRDHDFIFELRNIQIENMLEEHILKHINEDNLYVVETILFDEELHDMLNDLAAMHRVSIVVRVG